MKTSRAVFLDRDGVLNEDSGYTHRIEDLKLLPGVPAALAELRLRGFKLIVITNQSGVARGYFDEAAVAAFHAALDAELVKQGGAAPDAYFVCPHLPDAKIAAYAKQCECRKPLPGMVFQAIKKFNIDAASAFFVGDRDSDVECAVRAKVRAVHIVAPGASADPRAFATARSLADALRVLV